MLPGLKPPAKESYLRLRLRHGSNGDGDGNDDTAMMVEINMVLEVVLGEEVIAELIVGMAFSSAPESVRIYVLETTMTKLGVGAY
jgi:hypothetical protein